MSDDGFSEYFRAASQELTDAGLTLETDAERAQMLALTDVALFHFAASWRSILAEIDKARVDAVLGDVGARIERRRAGEIDASAHVLHAAHRAFDEAVFRAWLELGLIAFRYVDAQAQQRSEREGEVVVDDAILAKAGSVIARLTRDRLDRRGTLKRYIDELDATSFVLALRVTLEEQDAALGLGIFH